MSNTLNTPVEALELAYPLRVERYALRRNGRRRPAPRRRRRGPRAARTGTLPPLALTQRRRRAPQGAGGGSEGAVGHRMLNGEELPPFATQDLEPGDVLAIETPGGGGYGVL